MGVINKKLVHFNNKNSFDEQYKLGNVLDTSVVFIKDANQIRTLNNEYCFVNLGYLIQEIPSGFELLYTFDNEPFNASDGEFYIKR